MRFKDTSPATNPITAPAASRSRRLALLCSLASSRRIRPRSSGYRSSGSRARSEEMDSTCLETPLASRKPIDHLLQLGGKRSGDRERLAHSCARETQRVRMSEHPLQAMLLQLCVLLVIAVLLVTRDGITRMCGMHAYLVRAAGPDRHGH